MFHGLVLTSLTVMVARTALFSRKSREGFLDELDEIRSDALAAGEAEGDLWTDLREGGEYSDPHEISGLYADDSTPDRPTAKKGSSRAAARRADRKPPSQADAEPAAEDPVAAGPPPPPPPPPPAPMEAPTPPPVADAPLPSAPVAAVEAAPHPVRPSEMWHSADGAPAALGEPLAPIETSPLTEAPFDTASLPPVPPAEAPAPVGPSEPVDPFDVAADEPTAATEPIVDFTGKLVSGPVGRRHRRDRPEARPRATLPPAAPAPEAALPEPEATTRPPSAAEPAPAAPAPEPVAELVEPAADGVVGTDGALVRVAPDVEGEVRRVGAELTVALVRGWVWVAPGAGEAVPVSVDLPNSQLVVDVGSTVLGVVEPDGSSFVIVASGSASIGRGDDVGPLATGAIVMIDPAGAAQVDQAEPPEIEADPLVAANLAFDAEL